MPEVPHSRDVPPHDLGGDGGVDVHEEAERIPREGHDGPFEQLERRRAEFRRDPVRGFRTTSFRQEPSPRKNEVTLYLVTAHLFDARRSPKNGFVCHALPEGTLPLPPGSRS